LSKIFLLNKYLSENLNPWYGSETVGPPVLIGRGGLRGGGKTARKLQKMAPKGLESLACCAERGRRSGGGAKTGAMEKSLQPFEIAGRRPDV
jgi:hypothetical protein